MSTVREVTKDLHVVEAKQRFVGLEVGARMTVVRLPGGLLVHSPVAVDPRCLEPIGAARWVVAPNLLHHLHVGPWADAGLELWGAPGLADKRPDLAFDGTLDSISHPFGDDIAVLPMACFPMANEVAILHRPSRTLIVADLVFNFPATAPWTTRAAMRCLLGYPGCQSTLLERVGMRRSLARRELDELLTWDFDRLVMAHGEIVETGGQEALRHAFRWL